MTSNAAETILIAGAGIAGLTAAIALEQAGFHVQVVEQSPALRALGAGLTLQPNAMAAYALLGLEEAIGERGFLLRGGAIRRADGVVLTQMQPSDQLPNLGVAIHRARLLELLAQQLRVPILFGRRGCGYRQDEEGVSLDLEDGERLEGALLLACDGIHSAIRAQMLGVESLRYAGYTCWRGIAPALEGWTSRESAEHWGVGRRFGIVPIAEDEIYWFATVNAAPNEQDGEDVRGELLERFADFSEPIPALIAKTEASSILRNDILDRPPVKRWGDGRVTLVGDAAHPMTPNFGQGACQSIEDAVVLAHVLEQAREEDSEQGARSGALVGALRRYEALRIPRTAQIVEQAYRFGHVTQIESSSFRWLRDIAVRAIPNWITERATLDLMQLRLPD